MSGLSVILCDGSKNGDFENMASKYVGLSLELLGNALPPLIPLTMPSIIPGTEAWSRAAMANISKKQSKA